MFKEIMVTKIGLRDFIDSRDMYGNTCLHYVALLDHEDFIENLLNIIH